MSEEDLLQRITATPAIPAAQRIVLMERILSVHAGDLARGAVIAVRGERW